MSHRIAGALLAGLTLMGGTPAMAAEAEMPQVDRVEVQEVAPEGEDGVEIETDWRLFVKAGFKLLDVKPWGSERDNVFRNLLAPDYKARTGKDAPPEAAYGFVLANLTGGKFNDVLVVSHMPGDCDERGCMTIVFKMTEDKAKWDVVGRFHAMEVAHRYVTSPLVPAVPELAAIGDDVTGSTVYRWDGKGFKEAE